MGKLIKENMVKEMKFYAVLTQKTAETMKTISSRKTGELLVSLSLSLTKSGEISENVGETGQAYLQPFLRGSGRGFQGRGGRL